DVARSHTTVGTTFHVWPSSAQHGSRPRSSTYPRHTPLVKASTGAAGTFRLWEPHSGDERSASVARSNGQATSPVMLFAPTSTSRGRGVTRSRCLQVRQEPSPRLRSWSYPLGSAFVDGRMANPE